MEITKILESYLVADKTDYAIMINGAWGSGKTYYWKKVLSVIISKTNVPGLEKKNKIYSAIIQNLNPSPQKVSLDSHIKYQPIYISLFGVSTMEDLQNRIFVELNPFWKNKKVKTISNISKLLLNIATRYTGGEKLDKNEFKDFITGFSIKYNKVICFDDLERLDSKILNELFGLINLFVEHDCNKIIILCDENKIATKLNGDYLKTKEKIIRFTYNFIPNLSETFDNLSIGYKLTDYSNYFINYKGLILKIFETAEYSNIRTLKFIIDLFENIFIILNKLILDEIKIKIIHEKCWLFHVTYCIEYKIGHDKIKLNELMGINTYNIPFFDEPVQIKFANGEEAEGNNEFHEITFVESFRKKYLPFDSIQYKYFNSISNYIHTGYLNEDDLASEINLIIEELAKTENKREYEVLNKLYNFNMIDDEELQPTIAEVLKYIDEALYPIEVYPSFYSLLIELNTLKVLNMDLNEELSNRFVSAINNSSTSKYNSQFERLIPKNDNHDVNLEKVILASIAANETLNNQDNMLFAKRILIALEEKNYTLMEELIGSMHYKHLPIFSYMNSDLVFENLLQFTNEGVVIFKTAIAYRYNDKYLTETLKKELVFFNSLKIKLAQYINSRNTLGIKMYNLRILSNYLDYLTQLK